MCVGEDKRAAKSGKKSPVSTQLSLLGYIGEFFCIGQPIIIKSI